VEDRAQGVIASSVKRPEAAAVDRYVHGKILPAYANHIQVCVSVCVCVCFFLLVAASDAASTDVYLFLSTLLSQSILFSLRLYASKLFKN